MADLPSSFWSGWVIALTIAGSVCLLALLVGIYFSKQGGHETDPVWDGDLSEGNHPAPLWWFWLILSAMVFSVVYLMLYPGLGSFSGALHWSQQAQLKEHQAHHQSTHETLQQAVLAMPLEKLATNEEAMTAASRLFDDNCAACHGTQALGQANLFPNLRDGDWLWGGSPEQIEQTIRNGRKAAMPPWLAALKEEGVAQVASYVKSMASATSDELPGKALYQQFCVACHGADGAGNQALGAPRINDSIWLYGGEEEILRKSIANGRNGEMPAFATKLNDVQIRLLVAWLARK